MYHIDKKLLSLVYATFFLKMTADYNSNNYFSLKFWEMIKDLLRQILWFLFSFINEKIFSLWYWPNEENNFAD